MFINCSNHPSDKWPEEQLVAASEYGKIIDIPFPAVDPGATSQDIRALANQVVEEIMKHEPTGVMCQGEFTLTYAIVRMLSDRKVPVYAACSDRKVVETFNEKGEYQKQVKFEFVGFREYR